MRNEGDISALLTVQWGFKIIFKQWMTICLHTRSLMVVVAMEQGVGAAERWTGGVSSVSHTHKCTEVKARWIFSCQCKKKWRHLFFPHPFNGPQSLEPRALTAASSLCHCYWRLVHFPFHPSDLLKIQSHGDDPAFTARQRTVDKANVKRQHDKAHRGRSFKGKDEFCNAIFMYFHSCICHLWTHL